MRPAQIQTRISEDRPRLLTTQFTPKTVQLLLVKPDSFARFHACVRTQSVPDQAIRLDVIAAFDTRQMTRCRISLDVIPDKVSEMTWDAVRSSLSIFTHHFTNVSVVKLVKLVFGCSP